MSRSANNFKLGLFTLCGLTLLIAGILAFGIRGYFEPKSSFETYIEGDVNGLAIGSAVELRGVSVGKIRRIDFSWNDYHESQPNYVVVEFEMRDDITPWPPGKARSEMLQAAIARGLRARLKSQGVTGTCILSLEYLDPAANPVVQVPWTPRHTYIPAAPGQFGEMLDSIEKTLRNVEQLDFAALNQLLKDDLKSAGQVFDKMNGVDFSGLGTNANSLITELRDSNAKLKTFIGNTDDTVQKMKLEQLTQDIDGLANQLRKTVATLDPGLANLNFDALNQTLENARRSMRDLDEVILDLKQDPPGFLFGKPPPPLKVVQPPARK